MKEILETHVKHAQTVKFGDCSTGKGTQCCNGVCEDKVKDWIGAYYCKSDCSGTCTDSS